MLAFVFGHGSSSRQPMTAQEAKEDNIYGLRVLFTIAWIMLVVVEVLLVMNAQTIIATMIVAAIAVCVAGYALRLVRIANTNAASSLAALVAANRERDKTVGEIADRAQRAEGALHEIEWGCRLGLGGEIPICPYCKHLKSAGHEPGCQLKALIGRGLCSAFPDYPARREVEQAAEAVRLHESGTLLEAAKDALPFVYTHDHPGAEDVTQKLKAAIAKAEGK